LRAIKVAVETWRRKRSFITLNVGVQEVIPKSKRKSSMMKQSRFSLILCVCAAVAIGAVMTPARGQSAASPAAPGASDAKPGAMNMGQAVPEGKVTKVEDNKKICMVTNRAYDKDQIPVTVKGKTYYGCCDMCKSMLTGDQSKRMAVDPVSKKKVDKSEAVIGVAASGGVVYFQNDRDLVAYNRQFDSK
jgi:YHS domain-containing protein